MLGDDGAEGVVGAGLAAGDEPQVAGSAGASAILDGGHIDALLSEVLGSAGVIGYGGDGRAVLQAQLAVLGVAGHQVRGVVEDIGHELVHIVLSHIVAGQDHRAHRHRSGVGMLGLAGAVAVVAAAALIAAGHQAQRHHQGKDHAHQFLHNSLLLHIPLRLRGLLLQRPL